MKCSSSPIPMHKGLPSLATTISSGFSLSITAIAYAPTTWFSAIWTASPSLTLFFSFTYSIRLTRTSVSVSESKENPSLINFCFMVE